MLRYFLQSLGIPNVDDFALTAAEAAIAAALLRALVVPLLQKAGFWKKLPTSFQLLVLALVASFGAALDHFAGGNEARSSVVTGIAAFLGALGLEQGEKLVQNKKTRKQENKKETL